MEKRRGITIFSNEARFTRETGDRKRTCILLDTPGHTDFSPEMERTLDVLDLAILVISAPDKVTGQVRVLWNLLRRYDIPAFIFVNKMDQPGTDKDEILNRYLEGKKVSVQDIQKLIRQRKVFPVFWGSALKLEGFDELLEGIDKWALEKEYDDDFGARVYRITHDNTGLRLTWIRLTGGTFKAKSFRR